MKNPVVRSRSGRSCRQRGSQRRGERRARGRRGPRAPAPAPPPPPRRPAAPRPGPRSRGGRSCRSSRRGRRPAAAPAAAPRRARSWTATRRSIVFGDLRQRASGREARAPRSEQGASSRTRSKPGAISIAVGVGLDHGDAAQAQAPRLGGDFLGPVGVELDRDHLAAVAHPRRDLAGLDPGAGAEVEHVLARAAGRAPRPRRPSRGSAASARRRRPGRGPSRRCGPATTIISGRGQRPGPAAASASTPGRPRSVRAASRANRLQRSDAAGRAPPSSESRTVARSPTSAGSLQAASSERALRRPAPPTTSAPARAAPSGRRRPPPGSSRRQQRRGQLLALAGRAAQHRVDEAGGVGGAGSLDQLDRLVDGGVVGGAVGEEQLVEAEPQGRQHRRVEQAGRAPGQPFDRGVGGAAALDGAVGEPLGLGALAAVEAEPLGAGAEGALGEGVLLEGLPDRREGERAGRRDHGSFGSEWPRR